MLVARKRRFKKKPKNRVLDKINGGVARLSIKIANGCLGIRNLGVLSRVLADAPGI